MINTHNPNSTDAFVTIGNGQVYAEGHHVRSAPAVRKRGRSDPGGDHFPSDDRSIKGRSCATADQPVPDTGPDPAARLAPLSNNIIEDRDWTLIDGLNRSTVEFIAGVLAQQPPNPADALTTAMSHFNPLIQFATHTDRNGGLIRIKGHTVSTLQAMLNHACHTLSTARLAESALIAEAVIALLTALHAQGRCHVQSIAQLSTAARGPFITSRLKAFETLTQGQHLPVPDGFSPISLEGLVFQTSRDPMDHILIAFGSSQCPR